MTNCRRDQPIQYVADVVISAAQNREDVLLFRVFGGKRSGFYVDVGAGDPNWESVTNWFYRVGWRGINIDANPKFSQAYLHYRPLDVNLQVGISETPGVLTFYQVQANDLGHGWGLSSFDPTAKETARSLGYEVKEIEVPTKPLKDILREYADRSIDFLKIDVEGLERVVIASGDFINYRPVVVCVEAVHPASAEPSFGDWEQLLVEAGYLFALFDGVNNYYLRADSAQLLPQFNAGVNCNDQYRILTASDSMN